MRKERRRRIEGRRGRYVSNDPVWMTA